MALALSAIPVLAKVLADRGMTRSAFGQAVLAAGMIDDIIGWTAFALSILGLLLFVTRNVVMSRGEEGGEVITAKL